jgi:hypothetical protein
MVAGEDQGYLSIIITSIPIDSGSSKQPVGTAVREEKYIVVTTFKMILWHGKIQLLKRDTLR